MSPLPPEEALGVWTDLESVFLAVPDSALKPAERPHRPTAPETKTPIPEAAASVSAAAVPVFASPPPATNPAAKSPGARLIAFIRTAKSAAAKERLTSLLKTLASGATKSPLAIEECLDRAVSGSEDPSAVAAEAKAAGADLAVVVPDGLGADWLKALAEALRSAGIARRQIDAFSAGRKASVIEIIFKLQF